MIEAAVIGKPDRERTEIVKAYVVLSDNFEPSDALAEDLCQYVKRRLSAHAYPREIAFVKSLPKTPSGKLQRFILRNSEVAAAGGMGREGGAPGMRGRAATMTVATRPSSWRAQARHPRLC